MTVSNQTSKNVYVGDGATLVFAYTFRIFADGDLEVTIQDTSVDPQTEIALVLNTDYTVSGADSPTGGNVTLVLGGQLSVAPIATDNVTIRRNLPIIQPTDYVENDPFPAESHERELDRGRMIDQQLQEELDRSIKLSANITGVDVSLPTPEADAPIGWNSTATGLTNNPSNTNLSQIDTAATPDFIGATAGDGVLRSSGILTYTDGGDFVTIGLTNANIDHNALTNYVALEHLPALDEDDLISDSDTNVATQQSIKAYVDAQITSQNEFIEMTDTPANYTGATLQFVRVNVGETALEFVSGLLNQTHTGDVTGSVALTLDPVAITNKPAATVASGDLIVVADIDDSNNLKQVTAASIGALAGPGATTFVSLTDTPANFTGSALLFARVNAGETALEFAAGGSAVQVLDEGVSLTADVASIDFVGAGVVATTVGAAVTVTIAGGGGATLDHDVNQTTHGFSVNEWVYHNGTIYALADASAAGTAESIGIVSAVADGDNFTVQFGGRITGLSGLTVGEAHFLSTTAGAITATAPSVAGEVIKPVLVADSTTTGFIFNMRGSEISGTSANSFLLAFGNATLSSGILTVTHNLGVQYVTIAVFDDNCLMVIPDEITATSTTVTTSDFTSFGTLGGGAADWHVRVIG